MRIGIPKEIKNLENRVAMVPSGVKALRDAGHTVLVELDAGLGSGIENIEYQNAGAQMVKTAKEAWDVDLVVKVKEPLPEEFQYFRTGLFLYTFLHLAGEETLTKALMEHKVRAIAYETIQLEDRSLPLLKPMSEIAGRMAPQVGAHYLEKSQGGRGVLLGGVPGVPRGTVTIIGGGVAGINAAKIAVGLGAKVNIIEKSQKRLEYLDDVFGSTINTWMSNHHNVNECVVDSDLVIGCVLVPGAKASKLVTKDMIKKMRPGSVLVDVAIDQGGCFETSRPTSHKNPVYELDGVIHYCVTNIPGVVARTSTLALTNYTIDFALLLARGPENAIRNNRALELGVNCWDGHCVYKQVADDLSIPFTPLKELF